MKKLTQEELRNFYKHEYVSQFPLVDNGKIKRLFKYISFDRHDKIVDFGCGNGLLLDFVFDKVYEYYGVDFSEEFIKAAQERAKMKNITNAHFICDDINNFCKHHHNYFDKAFTLDFSEHIYDEDFLEIYSSIKESLKDNKQLYLHTPNSNYILELLRKRNIILKQLPPHIALRNGKHYQNLLTKVGFKKIEILHIPHYIPVLSYLHFLSYFPLIGKYLRARLFIICRK